MTATILVIEDEALIADDIQRTLIRLGYEVPVTVATGREAIRAAEQIRPQLALMDIQLEGAMDGIDTAREIRLRFGIPVVYLTSHSDEKTLGRAKETQPYGYLLKPFNDRELRTAIEVALHKHTLEARLAERERWFSTTLQSIGDAVIATDPSESVTFMNEVAEKLTGWKQQDAVGKNIREVLRLVDAHGAPLESPVARALRSSFAVEVPRDAGLVAKGGTQLDVDDTSAPIIDDHGLVIGGVIVFRDITERKKLEQRLAQSERLAAIGTMAAAMGHEINNPLTYIIGNVGFALEELRNAIGDLRESTAEASPLIGQAVGRLVEIEELLRETNTGADRVRTIVHDLKKFSRAEEHTRTVVDLPDIVDSAVKMTATAVRHHARLRKNYGTTPYVDANEGQLVQVFTNLLINAAQAIGEGNAEHNEIVITTYTDSAGRAVAEVQDTGPGIAPSSLSKVFDPFFTTKSVDAGTGIGLSICHNVIGALGGEITVESELGKGATFRVKLLPAASKVRSLPPQVAPVLLASRRGRVLVVDDEPAVARTLERMLRAEHDVTVVTDGHTALARIAEGERYDVIFCDLMMPVLTGMDLHESLSTTKAEQAARMVFTTGGAFSQRSKDFLESIGNVMVPKPFSMETIRSIARDYVK